MKIYVNCVKKIDLVGERNQFSQKLTSFRIGWKGVAVLFGGLMSQQWIMKNRCISGRGVMKSRERTRRVVFARSVVNRCTNHRLPNTRNRFKHIPIYPCESKMIMTRMAIRIPTSTLIQKSSAHPVEKMERRRRSASFWTQVDWAWQYRNAKFPYCLDYSIIRIDQSILNCPMLIKLVVHLLRGGGGSMPSGCFRNSLCLVRRGLIEVFHFLCNSTKKNVN